MAFKLVISDAFIEVPVKGSIKNGERDVTFAFTLTARRLSTDALRQATSETSGVLVREFLAENITGWKNQRLVVDDDGTPAPFGAEAFELLLSLVGMELLLLASYTRALQATDTSAGRAKN